MKLHYTLSYILLIFLLSFSSGARGADETQYSELVKKAQRLPSAQILNLADKYAGKEKTGEALVLYSVVYNRINKDMSEKSRNDCALARLKAGRIYYRQGNYINALEMFVAGVEVSEPCDRPLYAAQLYNNIGNVYSIFLEYEKGVGYYLKAYDYCRKMPDRETEHDILVNVTGITTFLRKMDDARRYYRMAEKTKNPADTEDVFMSGYTLSLIQIYEKNYAPAVSRLKRLAKYAADKKMAPKYQCFAYQELYSAYNSMENPDSTLKYLRLCYDTACRHDLQHTFVETLKSLSAFYEKEGDIASANKYKTQYLDIKDSIYNIREFDAVKNTLLTYEVGKTSKEIEDLRTREEERMHTIRMQRAVMLAVGAVLLLITVFLVVVWRQKKKINRSYADLYTVNRDFIATQETLTARLRKDRDMLRDKETEIETLRVELDRTRGEAAGEEKDAAKYQTSNLSEDKRQTLAEQIQNVMENTLEFCDCDFSLDTLAGLVGSNSKYVSQVINDAFNKSFSNYVNPYRIHLACKRFDDIENYGQYTMRAIALSVGFKSYTSFANIFKKITGITPSLYQKMAREGESKQE